MARWLTSSWRSLWPLFAVACIAGYLLPTAVSLSVYDRGVQVSVDARIQSGRVVELYVNGYRHEPITTLIVPGVRHTYNFPPILENVNFLRIDLGKINGAEVEVFEIAVSVDGKPAKRYGPDVIHRWVQSQPETIDGAARLSADSVRYVQKVYGPSLITYDVFAGGIPPGLRWLLPQDKEGIVLLFWAAFLLLVALGNTPLAARGQTLLILLAVPAVAIGLTHVLNGRINWPDPVDQAVGRAGYLGLSLIHNRLLALGVLTTSLMLSASAILLARRRPHDAAFASGDSLVTNSDHRRGLRRVVAALVVLVVASMFLSEVYGRINNLTIPFTNDWDGSNVNLWQYLVYRGLRPLRDFWFPYGGTWIFALPAPWGQLSESAMRAAVYIVCFLALVRICGLIPAILIIYIVLVSDRIQLMWAPWRYLLGVNVPLSYAAIGLGRRFSAGHLLFGAALCLALFFEPLQVAYATPAVLALLALDLMQRRTSIGMDLVTRLAREFALPVVYLIVYFTLISGIDELHGIMTFILSLGPHAYSSAVPTDFFKDVQWPFGVGLLLLAMPSALLGAGLYRRFSGHGTARVLDDVLIALGIVGFMYFQKHLVRPVEWQFVTPTLLAMLIWLAADRAFRHPLAAGFGGVAAGILFWSLTLTGAPEAIARQAVAAPMGALKSVRFIADSPDAIARIRDNSYAPARFSGYPRFNEIAERLRALAGSDDLPTVYAIGDLPMLYAMLHQPPPFGSDEYDDSPIFEQRRVLDWLAEKQPRFAVWNTNDSGFDGFQRIVRVPLLYAAAAENFVPVDMVGEFAILRRRNDGEPAAIKWWYERLGGTIDFGGLLRSSSFERLPDCRDAPSLTQCTPFLQIDVPPAARVKPRIGITISAGEFPFRIEFATTPNLGTYRLRLDRLWFWTVARNAGLPFRIVGADDPSVTATLTTKAPDTKSLY